MRSPGIRSLAIALSLIVLCPFANAQLVIKDDPTYGAGSITLDTATGKEWLDLTQTAGLSIDAVLANATGPISDFDVATVAQVEALFSNAGWSGVDYGSGNGSPVDLPAANLLMSSVGITLNGFDPFGAGSAMLGNSVLTPFYQVVAGSLGRIGCLSGFTDPLCEVSTGTAFSSPFYGVFLVRDADSDGDGVADISDNCTTFANANQLDTDGDSIGNACDADLDNDCAVTFSDVGLFKAAFPPTGTYDEQADFNGDGFVNFADLARLKQTFFSGVTPGPGPSGLPNACSF